MCKMCKRMICPVPYGKLLAAAVCLMLSAALIGSIARYAGTKRAEADSRKYYTSITVEKGDTLWSIAAEHIAPEHGGMESYIQEIRNLNHLYDDGIYAGAHLMIPRYDADMQGMESGGLADAEKK